MSCGHFRDGGIQGFSPVCCCFSYGPVHDCAVFATLRPYQNLCEEHGVQLSQHMDPLRCRRVFDLCLHQNFCKNGPLLYFRPFRLSCDWPRMATGPLTIGQESPYTLAPAVPSAQEWTIAAFAPYPFRAGRQSEVWEPPTPSAVSQHCDPV